MKAEPGAEPDWEDGGLGAELLPQLWLGCPVPLGFPEPAHTAPASPNIRLTAAIQTMTARRTMDASFRRGAPEVLRAGSPAGL